MRIDPSEVARLVQAGQAPPLEWIPHIVELRLERSYITDLRPFTAVRDVASLAGMTELEACFLTGSLVEDVAPLAGLARLERLDLGDTRVSDATPLAGLHGLRSLDLSATRITDVAPLAGLTALSGIVAHRAAGLVWMRLFAEEPPE